MKQIINGKLYDTDTAQLITELTNGKSLSDYNYYSDRLYKKKSGEYFLCEETYSSIAIKACTLEMAKKFAEDGDAEDYMLEFGKVEE